MKTTLTKTKKDIIVEIPRTAEKEKNEATVTVTLTSVMMKMKRMTLARIKRGGH